MDKKSIMAISGENVRRYRIQRGMTREQLAELADCDASTVARIESGSRMMSLRSLLAIAQALNISTDALLMRSSEEQHLANIMSMVAGQSPASRAHLEKIIYACIMEYGEADSHL